MENEIEEKLEEIYSDFIDVKFRDFGIYDVFLTLKGGKQIAVVFHFNVKNTMEVNIRNLQMKIDNEIIKLHKKKVNLI